MARIRRDARLGFDVADHVEAEALRQVDDRARNRRIVVGTTNFGRWGRRSGAIREARLTRRRIIDAAHDLFLAGTEFDVFLADEPFGDGSGRSKKEAEQNAARQALERMESEPLEDQEGAGDARAS